jgi:hypothetical protein
VDSIGDSCRVRGEVRPSRLLAIQRQNMPIRGTDVIDLTNQLPEGEVEENRGAKTMQPRLPAYHRDFGRSQTLPSRDHTPQADNPEGEKVWRTAEAAQPWIAQASHIAVLKDVAIAVCHDETWKHRPSPFSRSSTCTESWDKRMSLSVRTSQTLQGRNFSHTFRMTAI